MKSLWLHLPRSVPPLCAAALLLTPPLPPLSSFAAEALPHTIRSGPQNKFHVQGIAVDQERGFVYFSFTNELLKTDLNGKLIGSVTGLVGHLGDLTFDPVTNQIYGSLEYKGDSIGKSIRKNLGVDTKSPNAFYIAIFNADKITKPHIDAAQSDVMTCVYLKEVADDYEARVKVGDKEFPHRFGCSGIDGITLGPAFGEKPDPNSGEDRAFFLYVAYGIYSDVKRDDNDHQVILKYDISQWGDLARPVLQEKLHNSGPTAPDAKYFVYTGNTSYGIQNLEYDSSTGHFFAAVYRGKKVNFPNYRLFVIDGHKSPETRSLLIDGKSQEIETLSLTDAGMKDEKSGIRGWDFPGGSTGLWPLGNGMFYLANKTTKDKKQAAVVQKYKWTGNVDNAFELTDD